MDIINLSTKSYMLTRLKSVYNVYVIILVKTNYASHVVLLACSNVQILSFASLILLIGNIIDPELLERGFSFSSQK